MHASAIAAIAKQQSKIQQQCQNSVLYLFVIISQYIRHPPPFSHRQMKGEVTALIKELKGACRRPLFKGIHQASSTIRDGTTTSHDNASGPLTVTPSESTSEASETGSTVSAPKATPVAAGGAAAAASKRSHAEAQQQQQHRSWHEVSEWKKRAWKRIR